VKLSSENSAVLVHVGLLVDERALVDEVTGVGELAVLDIRGGVARELGGEFGHVLPPGHVIRLDLDVGMLLHEVGVEGLLRFPEDGIPGVRCTDDRLAGRGRLRCRRALCYRGD